MNIDSSRPSSPRLENTTESPHKNQVQKKSGSKPDSSSLGAVGGSSIHHRKPEIVFNPPLSSPEPELVPKLDPQFVTIRDAVIYFDKKQSFTEAEEKLSRDELEKMKREDPEFFRCLEGQYEPDLPMEIKLMMGMDKLFDTANMPGKEKQRRKDRAATHIHKESQRAEKKLHKQGMAKSVNFCTRLLLEEFWLGEIKKTLPNRSSDQTLCDLNELLRLIGNLKTRHEFLPGLHAEALRQKISVLISLGKWSDTATHLEILIRRFPEYIEVSDTLSLYYLSEWRFIKPRACGTIQPRKIFFMPPLIASYKKTAGLLRINIPSVYIPMKACVRL